MLQCNGRLRCNSRCRPLCGFVQGELSLHLTTSFEVNGAWSRLSQRILSHRGTMLASIARIRMAFRTYFSLLKRRTPSSLACSRSAWYALPSIVTRRPGLTALTQDGVLVEYDLDGSNFDNHLVFAKRYKLEDTATPTALLECQPGSEQILLTVRGQGRCLCLGQDAWCMVGQ